MGTCPALCHVVEFVRVVDAMKLYLCGPISPPPGPRINRSVFFKVARKLRKLGHKVVNPVELPGEGRLEWRDAMARDIREMVLCDAVVVLPNWVYSDGATIEQRLARELDIPVLDINLKPWKEPIAREAERIVYGKRQEDYAPPKKNFDIIAKFWSTILGIHVTPSQVSLCMMALKMSREMNRHSRDNLVDIIGYSVVLSRLMDEE